MEHENMKIHTAGQKIITFLFYTKNDLKNRFTVKRLCKPFCVCFSRSIWKIVRQCD